MGKAYARGYEDAMNGRPCISPYFRSMVARRDYELGWLAAPRRRR